MKTSSYLKEKSYLILIAFLTFVMMLLFLIAVQCNQQVIVVIGFLFWGMIFAILLIEYLRRANYYRILEETLHGLDQKYLLAEIIEEAQFMDGEILYATLQEVNRSMIEHINSYRQREEEYKDYIEMWVHEIKTPLAASKLIVNNNVSEVTRSIEEELYKVEAFVEQALFYARSTTLEKDYIIKELNLSNVLNKVIRKNSKMFIYKKIKISLPETSEIIFCDSKWLEFILDQIIGNALKYTDEAVGEIKITTKKSDEAVLLSIQDNGIGIPLEDMNRIFQKGFTGNNGRTNEKATGMGLYLCKLLCEKLYLDIKATSQIRLGTTITITFPTSSMMLLK